MRKSHVLVMPLALTLVMCKTARTKTGAELSESVETSEAGSIAAGDAGPKPRGTVTPSVYVPPNYRQPLGMDKQIVGPLAPRLPMTKDERPAATLPASQSAVSPTRAQFKGQGNGEEAPALSFPVHSDPFLNRVCSTFNFGDIAPLRCLPVPQPTQTDIINPAAAIVLGKALFWDIQAGGDGQTACATCHFVGGADPRRNHVINPGPDGVFEAGLVVKKGQNFFKTNLTSDDRAGSPGVAHRIFQGISTDPKNPADICTPVEDPVFGQYRQVTGRNTPSSIGVVYYRQLFWDGRAHHSFNGNDPFGTTANASDPVSLCENCGLASQAVGPANNEVEMSCTGRPFHGEQSLAAKLLPRAALQFQEISSSDSVLRTYANFRLPKKGMICDRASNRLCTYQELVDLAFRPEIAGPQAIHYFARIWGQAIQAYLATLNPTQTPLDRYLEGNTFALTTRQKKGLSIFRGKGECIECHAGAELSDATHSYILLEGDVAEFGNDVGFHNLGVRPTEEDLGRAGPGPTGAPFAIGDSFFNRGAFKTPMLRNVKLTAPYFHNGGMNSLEDVVEFYSRGGDFANAELSPDLKARSFNADEKAALVDFLRNGLTDPRVEFQKAPFDHPSLPFPSGVTMQASGANGGPISYLDSKGRRVPLP